MLAQLGNMKHLKFSESKSTWASASHLMCEKCRSSGFGSWVRIFLPFQWWVGAALHRVYQDRCWIKSLQGASFIWNDTNIWFFGILRFLRLSKPCVHVVPGTLCVFFNLNFFWKKNFPTFCMGPGNPFQTAFLRRGDALSGSKNDLIRKPCSQKARDFSEFLLKSGFLVIFDWISAAQGYGSLLV